MKKLVLGNPGGPNDVRWAQQALKLIERASYEDIESIFDEYTITGTVTETRTFDAATATADDLRNVLATLFSDIQKRGSKRQPNDV